MHPVCGPKRMLQEPDSERLYLEPLETRPVRHTISEARLKLIVPALFVVLALVFIVIFKASTFLQQKSLTIPLTCFLFLLAAAFAAVDIAKQARTELQAFSKFTEKFEPVEWEMSAVGLGQWCRLCDDDGIYYTAHHQNRWVEMIVRHFSKPVFIPWSEVQSVSWLPDRISIVLYDEHTFYAGHSDTLYSLATANMPEGTVTDESDEE